MKTSLYEIDVTHDYPLEDVLKSMAGHGMTLEKYIRTGPGGGNQNFFIRARPTDWNAWCLQNYSEEPESHRIGE